MPSRIIREGINTSARINALSPLAELFYRRLMTVADDYGRYYASAVTLRGACWPTCPERVTDSDISTWLSECLAGDNPLLIMYEADGCRYLQFANFGQQTRTKSKFPDPAESKLLISCESPDKQMLSLDEDVFRISKSNCVLRISESNKQVLSPLAVEPPEPDKTLVRSFGPPVVEIPRKTLNGSAPPARSQTLTPERIAWMKAELHGYMASTGIGPPLGIAGPPDGVVLRCLEIVEKAPRAEVSEFLRDLWKRQPYGKPGGPKDYRWFITILGVRFGPEAKPPPGNQAKRETTGATR